VGGRNREVRLTGPDLPQHFPDIPGRVRGKETWYPGSSKPTSQVLGPEEGELTFSGMFEDRKFGVPLHAQSMMTLLDQIRRAARPVRFEYGPITRACRWIECSFHVEELTRIGYSMTLQIVDHEFGDSRRVFPDIRRIPGVGPMLDAATAVSEVLNTIPQSVGGAALDKARDAMNAVLKGAGIARDALDGLGAGVDATGALGFTASTALSSAKTSLRDAAASVRSLSYTAAAGSAFDAVTGPGLTIAEAGHGIVAMAQELDRVHPEVERLSGQSFTTDRVYVAAQGETLQRIALRFYGDSGAWTRIARANGKDSASVVAGEQLTLPNVPSTDTAVGLS